ncbi:serine hydrolase [Fictibacillus nanhaiensis]|uniref:serine hydrolase n=1 Tax=Fictibacillus nanhaiensis TaxID=742169 RepID=UPI002E23266E|nr:serine hydrolase [Fictibacillus nanhaiensis]MED1864448.1 serine hydrolase [Fictibacillus nanhaiensis]
MERVVTSLKTVESDQVGIIIYSTKLQEVVCSFNSNLIVPLASAAKVVIGYCVTKWVENGLFHWNDLIEDFQLDKEENSTVLFPHFQGRASLSLGNLVEVMIACHDSKAADSVVKFCGGWEKLNRELSRVYNHINVTSNPRDVENRGELGEVLQVLKTVYKAYQTEPHLWLPVMNGLVRPQDHLDGIPNHMLNHMSGGLENLVVDIGILGVFHQYPLLYVLGVNNIPNRYSSTLSDERIVESMKLLYHEYNKQKKEQMT